MLYEICDLKIEIQNRLKYTDNFCKNYLSSDQACEPILSVKVSDEAFYAEKNASPGYSDGYIENICLYREICLQLPKFNRFLLHSCILEYNGEAYAFLGRSGTGKSTHTGLWLKYLADTKILNGDKPILKVNEKEVIAYGTPWMGKEGLGYNGQAPLKALCFLEQAKVNEIRQLSPAEASMRIFQQILLPSEQIAAEKTLEMIDALLKRIPSYLLRCDISEEAVKTSFEVLTKCEYNKNKIAEKENEN